ncbi:MAG TPA: flagellar assembly peptidoglycan hydrolase FlgJ [Rhodocyclaceae bacterium]
MTTTGGVDPNIFDNGGLAALKRQARDNDPQALKAAARQFEALFLQMVLKSMRDATPKDGMFDSDQTRMYESLLDQQLAQVMSSKGGGTGLAAMIEKQLGRSAQDPVEFPDGLPLNSAAKALPLERNPGGLNLKRDPGPQSFPLQSVPVVPAATVPGPEAQADLPAGAREFVARVWPNAVEASRATGIPAHFLVAHAALETGWGKSEPRLADGRPSFNLFGIKAGRGWNGGSVEATTTEFVDGAPQRQTERFRAYGSYAESFRDYANLLASNPRYASVVGARDGASFARGLQQAGYATDPGYARKLERIIGGDTLRSALQG